jgi:hypothetical protein
MLYVCRRFGPYGPAWGINRMHQNQFQGTTNQMMPILLPSSYRTEGALIGPALDSGMICRRPVMSVMNNMAKEEKMYKRVCV